MAIALRRAAISQMSAITRVPHFPLAGQRRAVSATEIWNRTGSSALSLHQFLATLADFSRADVAFQCFARLSDVAHASRPSVETVWRSRARKRSHEVA